mmetsp:Transcript_60406/g.148220  ORF Transcript_60406/g.148220 Transcript_60406/m.148220 type:complete len:315 (+) Transcript_60406:220-1164(+)
MCQARCFTNKPRGPPSLALISSNDLSTTPTAAPRTPKTSSTSSARSSQQVPVETIKTKKRVTWKESVRCTFIKGCTKDTWYDEDDYGKFQDDVFNTIDQYKMRNSNSKRRGATPRRSSMSSTNTMKNATAATTNDAANNDEKVCIRGLEHFAEKTCRKAKRQARVTAWLTVLDLQDEQWEAQIAAVAAASTAGSDHSSEESDTDSYNSGGRSSSNNLLMMMDMSSTASPRCVDDFPINNYNDPETRQRIMEANAEALAKEYQKVTFGAKQEAFLRGVQDQIAADAAAAASSEETVTVAAAASAATACVVEAREA